MRGDLSFKFKDYIGILQHENRMILGNTNNGKWIKISKECFEILNTAIDEKYTINEFMGMFQEKKDAEYIKGLVKTLEEMHLLEQGNEIEEKIPKSVTFSITERCNLRCSHCCVSAEDTPDVLDIEDCKTILRKLVDMEPEQIVFTGGEPLIRRDALDLFKYTRDIFKGHIGLMTNGTLFTEKNLPVILETVDSIDISLDGVDEDSCAAVRGVGVFSKVMEAIDQLHEKGFHSISLSMVMTQKNQSHMDEFFELNKSKETKPMLRAFSPMGRGEENRDDLEIKEKTLRNPKKYDGFQLSDMKICSCGALKRTIYINCRGEIYPCPVLLDQIYCLGNVLDEQDLMLFFSKDKMGKNKNYDTFTALYPQNYPECKDCDVNLFCWSCLHHIDLLKKGIIKKDSNCAERKRQLQKLIWEEDA